MEGDEERQDRRRLDLIPSRRTEPRLLLGIGAARLVLSGIGPKDRFTFLGTQGDVWDTQWDMFLYLLGALTAQLTLSRLHDRQLAALEA